MPFNDMGWLVPAIGVGTWLFLATLSFEQIEGWQPGESFFYVIDTGLCRGFGSVKPATALGQAATIANELFGACAAAVLLGQFAQRILENAKESGAVAKVTKVADSPELQRHVQGLATKGAYKAVAVDVTGDGVADGIGVDTTGDGTVDTVIYYERQGLVTASRVLLVTSLSVWIALGAAYGAVFEGWSLPTSLFFATTTLGIGGLQSPVTDSAGVLPELHAVLVGVYVLVGVPLFASVVGDVVGYFLEDRIRREEQEAMDRPIEMEDFTIASQLIDPDGQIGKAEYILLELMRLGKTDVGSIAVMAQRFEKMDTSGDGSLDKEEILRFNDSFGPQ